MMAFIIGLAFGACLERSGLGSAKKLMGQFNLTDLAVFKVMFSAIITAMLGMFWLSRFGLVDVTRVYVPETFILPQLVGGVVFGAGFALAGLCPGTSCVAAASGRGDGLAVVLGMFAGVLGFGFVLPSIETFYSSTSRGALTLPTVLGMSQGGVVLLIVFAALVGFVVAEWLEQRPGTPT
ncbi:MAG: DUF6691 family protein [Gemmatimonadaceae bacterium]